MSDHFIGHGGHAGFHQGLGQGDVGGKVKVGEENLIFSQERVFGRQGFLDLDDQVGGKGIGMIRNDFGSRLDVFLVGVAGADSGFLLHKNLMAPLRQLVGGGGQEGDAGFLGLDLTWNADDHGVSLPSTRVGAREENAGLAEPRNWD